MTLLDPLSISIPTASPAFLPSPRRDLPTRKLLQPSPTHPDDYILEIDYSALSDYLCCARQFENHYVFSRQGKYPPSATEFGKLFHSCEELRLRGAPNWQQAQTEKVIQHFSQNPVPPDEYRTGDRMLEVLSKYNTQYAEDGWPGQVVQHEGQPFVERPFKLELCSIPLNCNLPYPMDLLVARLNDVACDGQCTPVRSLHIQLTGRIDLLLYNSNSIFVVDHKTTSMGGKMFEDAFYLSLQTRGYTWAAKHILGLSLDDPTIPGLIANAVLVKPPHKTERGKSETIVCSRHTYFYSGDSLHEWEDNIKAHVSDLVHCLVRGYFPQTSLSFMSPCARCDMQLNCRLPRHQRAADLYSDDYQNVVWNPIDNID